MKKALLIFTLVGASFSAQAQLFIDNNYTIEDMINGFFNNSGVNISNITYSGTPLSLAFFEGSQSNIGMNAGLMITTGDANLAVGPNNNVGSGVAMNVPGTPWLDALIPGYNTYDASVIEMDIVPESDTLSFKYVFASEEYKEFVNSQFNDLFAFFIDGPGLPMGDTIYVPADTIFDYSGCIICVDTLYFYSDTICYYDSLLMADTCFIYNDTMTTFCYDDPNCTGDTLIYPAYFYISPGGTNIAMVPNSNLPVTINTINQFDNTQYFIDNAGGATVEYDAFTTPLWATIPVTPLETYHVRIAIADAGDAIYDSGVFLSIESLGGDSLLSVDPDFLVVPTTGNQVNFDNKTLWATKWHWDFGDGSTSEAKFPTHTYAEDGTYTVTLTASNWCSQKSFVQEIQIGAASGQNEPVSNIFKVMPNPTHDAFILDLQRDAAANVRIQTLDGRVLIDQFYNDGARINLANYENGIYILQIVSGGKVYTDKIVKF